MIYDVEFILFVEFGYVICVMVWVGFLCKLELLIFVIKI